MKVFLSFRPWLIGIGLLAIALGSTGFFFGHHISERQLYGCWQGQTETLEDGYKWIAIHRPDNSLEVRFIHFEDYKGHFD